MSDYERYGDYDRADEDETRPRTRAGLILKILIAALLVSVIAFLAFRLILFRHYPRSVSDVVFTPPLADYYAATDGDIAAVTQKLRYPYSDAKNGYFFCSELIAVPGAKNVQFALRYNVASVAALGEE